MTTLLPPVGGHGLALSIAMPTPRFLKLRDEIRTALPVIPDEIVQAYSGGI